MGLGKYFLFFSCLGLVASCGGVEAGFPASSNVLSLATTSENALKQCYSAQCPGSTQADMYAFCRSFQQEPDSEKTSTHSLCQDASDIVLFSCIAAACEQEPTDGYDFINKINTCSKEHADFVDNACSLHS